MCLRINLMMSKLLILMLVLVFFKRTSCDFPASCMSRMVDGHTVDINEVPYMLAVQHKRQFMGVATIIKENFAITAARCVTDTDINFLKLHSGSNSWRKKGKMHDVIKILLHPTFSNISEMYDIALLEVSPPFENTANTHPVTLPTINSSPDVNTGVEVSYGQQKRGTFKATRILSCRIVFLMDKKQCDRRSGSNYGMTPNMTCYGSKAAEGIACEGDLGAPLVNKDGILIGILVFFGACKLFYVLDVYTIVPSLLPWILENIKNTN